MDTPHQITAIHPGFIRSEINEKVKKVPFIVDTETGCKAMVKAIERRGKLFCARLAVGVAAVYFAYCTQIHP